MQITAKFAILFAAVAYGSLSVAALPTYKLYDTRDLSADFNARDLSYLDIRDYEDFRARDIVTPPSPPPLSSVPADGQANPATAGGPTRVTPPPVLTPEHQAVHEAALADPMHPEHPKALDHHQSVLADPTHPHHAQAQALDKLHQKALKDRKHPLHKHAKALEREKLHQAALANPENPGHAAAKDKEARRKAFRKQHEEALKNPNHELHQKAQAYEAKKKTHRERIAALKDSNNPGHQAAMKEHEDKLANQQGHSTADATEGAHPDANTPPVVAGPAVVRAKLRRRDYY